MGYHSLRLARHTILEFPISNTWVRYEIETVRKERNNYYSLEPKWEIMNKVLLESWFQLSVSLTYNFRM